MAYLRGAGLVLLLKYTEYILYKIFNLGANLNVQIEM